MHNEPTAQSGVPFPEEAAHLAQIGCKLEEALHSAQADVERIGREYAGTTRYMADYRGELDPHEMFHTELLLRQTVQTGAFSVGVRDRIAKLRESPYFARIDFESGGAAEKIYIGRFSFRHENELLIFDWRAPVASMFYDCEVGPAGYDAPLGRVDGALTRKRQFKIKNGVMEYVLESASHVQDDVLQRELAHTSDEKMKSIIATIQKEQNRIIRSEKAGTLIIQGVAGSGKTSIALHRIAFLLYRFKDRLRAQNIAVLSPNKVFADYISGVIPELGEEPVCNLDLLGIVTDALGSVIGFEPDRDPLEACGEAWAGRVRFKSTLDFLRLLDEYITSLPGRIFAPADYTFGPFTVKREWIGGRFRAYAGHPIKRRLALVAEDILHRFETDHLRWDELPKIRSILKSLTGMLTFKSTLALYKNFYRAIGEPQMFALPAKKTLEWADVCPFLYLHAAFEGVAHSGATKHLVIDEMQYYTPVQHAVLNLLFPCEKTILGDFGQLLNPFHSHTLADLRSLYAHAEFAALNKSYRSTFEIMAFAKRVGGIASLDAVERHGREPAVTACGDEPAQIRMIQNAVRVFNARANASLGIILKTNAAAKAFHCLLCGEVEATLISPGSTGFSGGVSVSSVQMAKGLEFDEVIIPQATRKNYCSDYDRSLLYIACTRALHGLTLFYTGDPSPLIGNTGR